jgi:hypothetical protein
MTKSMDNMPCLYTAIFRISCVTAVTFGFFFLLRRPLLAATAAGAGGASVLDVLLLLLLRVELLVFRLEEDLVVTMVLLAPDFDRGCSTVNGGRETGVLSKSPGQLFTPQQEDEGVDRREGKNHPRKEAEKNDGNFYKHSSALHTQQQIKNHTPQRF